LHSASEAGRKRKFFRSIAFPLRALANIIVSLHKSAILRRADDGLSITATAKARLSYSKNKIRTNERRDRKEEME